MIPTIVQLPMRDRYTLEWYNKLYTHSAFRILGEYRPETINRTRSYNYFANLESSIQYEMGQVRALLYKRDVDKVFITDLDFPGIAVQMYPLLKLKYPSIKIYGILHAGSWCNQDIFAGDKAKKDQERLVFDICEKVFVATEYHRGLIEAYYNEYFTNIVVLDGMPFDYDWVSSHKEEKTEDVIVLGRPEQSDVVDFPYQYHTGGMNREDFLRFLSRYKVAIIPKVEETFGYIAMEAIALGTIPLVPDRYSYRQLLPKLFRCKDTEEFLWRAQEALTYPIKYTELFNRIPFDKYSNMWSRITEEINE